MVLDCLIFIWTPANEGLQSFLQTRTGEVVVSLLKLTAGAIVWRRVLESKAKDLRRETDNLTAAQNDVSRVIEHGKLVNMIPISDAERWLSAVGELLSKAEGLQESVRQMERFSWGSYYELGSRADELVREALGLKTERTYPTQLVRAPPDRVVLVPCPPGPIVAAENTLSEILRMLDNEESSIVGIYGTGGIGKTRLLTKLNNDLAIISSCRFDLVIFVTVSKDVRIDDVQTKIAERLGFKSQRASDMASKLYNVLFQKKFLLLLDDLWEKLDLGKVGIPLKKGSKVAFTTRFKDVCTDMDTPDWWTVKVPYLSPDSSWKLFCQKLGKREEDGWTEPRRSLAKEVANKCGGLPLALITVGRAMASATNDDEWEDAWTTLSGTAAPREDMEVQVLTLLRFSFDRIKDERHKKCLLYCALYPEDHNIEVDELFGYWVGEGFFEEEGPPLSLRSARSRGHRAITSLKDAGLLEEGEVKGRQVKVHDLVREMARWTTRFWGEAEHKDISVMRWEENGNGKDLSVMRWKDATRMRITATDIYGLELEMPHFKNLRALLLQQSFCRDRIPFLRFSEFVRPLEVLDLSFTGIEHLPPEIGSLVELRCLDLSFNRLVSLPKEVGKLTKLRILNLGRSFLRLRMLNIEKEAISPLSCLQSLNLFGTWNNFLSVFEPSVLQGLNKLEEVGFHLENICREDLHALLGFHRFFALMRNLRIKGFGSSSSIDMSDILGATENLEKLEITGCMSLIDLIFPIDKHTKLQELTLDWIPLATFIFKDYDVLMTKPTNGVTFKNLRVLKIVSCQALLEITWIEELPSLEILSVSSCLKMVEIIAVEEFNVTGMDSLFPNLKEISLIGMRNLTSICRQPLLFPSLELVNVSNCVKLKKLPFTQDNAKNIKGIFCDSEWKDHLEWDNEDIRLRFTPYFYCYAR